MANSNDGAEDKISVKIDKEIADLIPGFLDGRRKDILAILDALEENDFETIKMLGHSMKGSGGGYGFNAITDIGFSIEDAAKVGDRSEIKKSTEKLGSYIEKLEVEYV